MFSARNAMPRLIQLSRSSASPARIIARFRRKAPRDAHAPHNQPESNKSNPLRCAATGTKRRHDGPGKALQRGIILQPGPNNAANRNGHEHQRSPPPPAGTMCMQAPPVRRPTVAQGIER